ncbi:MAG: hypothetical protein ABI639_15880, partial [Thermoanaerobaculia bacterium]
SVTAASVKAHAHEIGEAFAFDGEEVIRAERMLIRYGVTSDSVLGNVSQLVADVARTLGVGLTDAAQMVGRALQEPGEGMKALRQAGLLLSENQIKLAKDLAETGQMAAAQNVVISALSQEVGGAAAAYRDTFSGALAASKVEVLDLAEALGLELLPGLQDLLDASNGIGGGGLVVQSIKGIGSALGDLLGVGADVVSLLNTISSFGSGSDNSPGSLMSLVHPIRAIGEVLGGTRDFLHQAWDAWNEYAGRVKQVLPPLAAVANQETATTAAIAKHLQLTHDLSKAIDQWVKDSNEGADAEEKFATQLQAILDKADPLAKAEREAAESTAILNRAFSESERDSKTYRDALAEIRYELEKVRSAQELTANDLPLLPTGDRNYGNTFFVADQIQKDLDAHPVTPTIQVTAATVAPLTAAFEESAANFAEHTEAGLVSAGEAFFEEMLAGGDDAWEHLGDHLKQVLLQTVAEWLAAQLAAIAKAALASKAIGGSSGGGGGSTGGLNWGSIVKLFGGGAGTVGTSGMAAGTYTSGFGGGAGGAGWSATVGSAGGAGTTSAGSGAAAGGGAWGAAAGFAFVAALAVIGKHQSDAHFSRLYNTQTTTGVRDGVVSSGYAGRLDTTGSQIAEAMGGIVTAIQDSTGALITGNAEAVIRIRNDKDSFELMFNGMIVDQFHTAGEAMLAGVKLMFNEGNIQGAIDPVVQQVIDNFQGSDPTKLVEATQAVQSIMDKLHGLTEIEVELRGLDSAASALVASLVASGVDLNTAQQVAEQVKAQRLDELRDQITGHQRTAAEELAERQRQAAAFNAKVTLERAQNAIDLATLKAHAELLRSKVQLDAGDLDMQSQVLSIRSQLYENSGRTEIERLELIGASNDVQEEFLQQQLALLDGQIAALETAQGYLDGIQLIDPSEIHIGGGHGGGGGHHGGGPTVPSGPTPEELAAQRAEDFANFLDSHKFDGLTDLQTQLAQLDADFAAQSQAAGEVAGGEEQLEAARRKALGALREGLIDSLGLPLEQARDRFAQMNETLKYLRSTMKGSEEDHQRYIEVLGEVRIALQSELLGIAADLADSLGADKDAAEFRKMASEIEYDMKVAQFELLWHQLEAVGGIGDEMEQRFKAFELYLLTHRPNFDADTPTLPTGADSGSYDNSADDALQAQHELIDALNSLADLQRDLWASDLSPLNAEQQTQFLAGEIQNAYNQANASHDPDDIRAFQDLIRDYLSSYQDSYGSTGGYSAEFLRLNEMINHLLSLGGIGGVVPGPGFPGGAAGTGAGGWRPTPGASANVLPFERTGGPTSPLVIESPALTLMATLAQDSNRRLGQLEARLGDIHQEARRGNDQAAAFAFRARSTGTPVGITGTQTFGAGFGA